MKTFLHMAVSIDGFIAKPNGDSDWVSKIDCNLFEERCKDIGCVVVGHRTYQQFQGSLYPMANITNIVLTRDVGLKSDHPNVFIAHSVEEAMSLAKEKGHEKVLIAGGGHTNGAFLDANLIDEIFLSIHPLNLNTGIKLFEGAQEMREFDQSGIREMGEGLVELYYQKSSRTKR